ITLSGDSFATLAEAQKAGAVVLKYGLFINTIIDFIIVALAIFLVIKQINRLKRAPAAEEATTKDCPFCFSAIPIKAVRCPNCTSDLKGV
ncbi:MAG: MscL family protein, partial [Thermodesulfobacteriota bacterium]